MPISAGMIITFNILSHPASPIILFPGQDQNFQEQLFIRKAESLQGRKTDS